MEKNNNPVEVIKIQITAHPEFLCVTRSAVRKANEIAGLSDKDNDSVTLAVDEALTNIIRHSYGGPCSKPIIIQYNSIPPRKDQPAALEIIIRDFGKQVDPATIKGRDLDEIRPGGLGVHIIQSVMDKVNYAQAEGEGMQLTMTKFIHPDENENPVPHTEKTCKETIKEK
jgi:anti-sigma regulatory factor (Ser/Thr protein kinase)